MDHHNQQHTQQQHQHQHQHQLQQHQHQQQQQQQQQTFSRPIAPNLPVTSVAPNTANAPALTPTVPTMYTTNVAAMGQHQHQHHDQQHQYQQHQHQHITVAPTVVANAMNSQVMEQLMTNPALAAVAAATPLLPPAAMMTNPGAFLTMPEYYRPPNAVDVDSQHQQQLMTAKTSAAAINSSVTVRPQLVTSGHQQPQQQHQQQQLFSIPGVSGVQYPTILPYGVALPNSVLSSTPGINPMDPSSVQVHMAANYEATQAIIVESNGNCRTDGKKRTKDLSAQERAQQNRDRNREHARSTRLRKKAYVSKLKDLVDGLHAERSEEVRQRRVAIQHLAETQDVRRAVVRSFLRFQSNYETDKRKWTNLLEDNFWLKQPVTPYRCFRRSEIENESRITRGAEGMIEDAASMAVMIESVGSRSSRWAQLKREEFIAKEEERTGRKRMPRNIVQRNNRFRHAISSISASSSDSSNTGSNNCSSGGEENNNNRNKKQQQGQTIATTTNSAEEVTEIATKNVSSSSLEGQCAALTSSSNNASGEFHDYHAKPLPDPKLPAIPTRQGSSGSSQSRLGDDSQEGSSNCGGDVTKRVISTSSGDAHSAAAIQVPSNNGANKRRKVESSTGTTSVMSQSTGLAAAKAKNNFLPTNMIAKKGGIAHNVRPVVSSVSSTQKSGKSRLALAPAVALPPFAGIGKRPASGISPSARSTAFASSSAVSMSIADNANANAKTTNTENSIVDATPSRRTTLSNVGFETPAGISAGPAPLISGDIETSSSNSSRSKPQIRAYYHFNEDDMIIMDDVIMCPFVFRTQDAVLCGALSECVMPGMLRGEFSSRNRLVSLEVVYDSMGLMQQLERCSGSEWMAQIIPGSLEMALSPVPYECRVITLAEPPYLIINVNEAWTKLTKYTQMDVEGEELFNILNKSTSDSSGSQASNAAYDLNDVSEGRSKCTTRFHFDKDHREFVDFMCSYPLTNAKDEVTHILHVSKELRSPGEESVELQDSDLGSSD